MNPQQLTGLFIVVLSGLVMGTSPWPLKLMKRFEYEHFGFVSMLVALFVIPWAITLVLCPEPFAVFEVPTRIFLLGNAFTFCWGIAQVLALLCFLRIGVSLTYGILCAVGLCVGVTIPMIFKASGVFAAAPDIFSSTGLTILAGVAVMLVGICLASLAGLGREKHLNAQQPQTDQPQNNARPAGHFTVSLIMVIVAGALSTGWGFAFSYTQDPITEVMKSHGASAFAASIAVWAFVLLGAAAVNVIYPASLMKAHRSWPVLANPKEISLSLIYGLLFFIPSALLGTGMVRLGVLGASVGWGVVQGTLIIGGQLLGFATGEWRGVHGKPRKQMFAAIAFIVVAIAIMALARA